MLELSIRSVGGHNVAKKAREHIHAVVQELFEKAGIEGKFSGYFGEASHGSSHKKIRVMDLRNGSGAVEIMVSTGSTGTYVPKIIIKGHHNLKPREAWEKLMKANGQIIKPLKKEKREMAASTPAARPVSKTFSVAGFLSAEIVGLVRTALEIFLSEREDKSFTPREFVRTLRESGVFTDGNPPKEMEHMILTYLSRRRIVQRVPVGKRFRYLFSAEEPISTPVVESSIQAEVASPLTIEVEVRRILEDFRRNLDDLQVLREQLELFRQEEVRLVAATSDEELARRMLEITHRHAEGYRHQKEEVEG